MTGLQQEDEKTLFTLDKGNEVLSMFLTGEKRWKCPLNHVHIFADMRLR